MSKNRGYLREMRQKKIAQRQRKIKNTHDVDQLCDRVETRRISKYSDIISGKRDGLLAKHDYGFISGSLSVKTNTRKGQSSYRLKGSYGRSNNYKRSDQMKIDDVEDQLHDFMIGENYESMDQ